MGDFPNTSQDHLTSVGIEPLTQIVSLLFPIKLHKQQPAFNPPPPPFISPVPTWAIGAIVVVVLALIACMGFCIYKKCVNKGKKPKKVRERKGGRGRRKKDKEGEEGDDKKVKKDINRFCLVYS